MHPRGHSKQKDEQVQRPQGSGISSNGREANVAGLEGMGGRLVRDGVRKGSGPDHMGLCMLLWLCSEGEESQGVL